MLPLREGFQEQVAVKFGELPVVAILVQPGIRTPPALKETLDEVSTPTIMFTEFR